jgi:hypothetical protein
MSVVHRFGLVEHQNNSFNCSGAHVRSGEDVRSTSLQSGVTLGCVERAIGNLLSAFFVRRVCANKEHCDSAVIMVEKRVQMASEAIF